MSGSTVTFTKQAFLDQYDGFIAALRAVYDRNSEHKKKFIELSTYESKKFSFSQMKFVKVTQTHNLPKKLKDNVVDALSKMSEIDRECKKLSQTIELFKNTCNNFDCSHVSFSADEMVILNVGFEILNEVEDAADDK